MFNHKQAASDAKTITEWMRVRGNFPVAMMDKENNRIRDQLGDSDFATKAKLEAFFIVQHEVFSLYSLDGKYICAKQFNVDKILTGYRDSLRKGWHLANGQPVNFAQMQNASLDGAYCLFNSKSWRSELNITYELDIRFAPGAVKQAKAKLIAAGNWFSELNGKVALIDGKKYRLVLA